MLAIGSDHGGFELKKAVMAYLDEKKIAYKDFGTYSEDSCDYPVYGEAVARAVASGECEKGLLFCGTGVGISIAANKVKGIRAVVCSDKFSCEMSRKHNDANILCLGGRVVDTAFGIEMVELWLNTEFEGGRHARRVGLISEIEDKN